MTGDPKTKVAANRGGLISAFQSENDYGANFTTKPPPAYQLVSAANLLLTGLIHTVEFCASRTGRHWQRMVGMRDNSVTVSGLFSDGEASKLDIMRGLRNDFAREPGASFGVSPLRGRANNLSTTGETPRLRFQFSDVAIIIGILRRLEHSERQRRQATDARLEAIWEDMALLPPDEQEEKRSHIQHDVGVLHALDPKSGG